MVELGALDGFSQRDDNEDGIDDRVIWQTPAGYLYQRHGYRALAIAPETGHLFVGLEAPLPVPPNTVGEPRGFDVWSVINVCCDLGVEMQQRVEDPDDGDKEEMLLRERRALEKGLAAGLAAAQSCGVPIGTSSVPLGFNSVTIIEQGSGACLWKDNPVSDCGKAYQPGLSDHDYEVFIPRQYLPGTDTSGGACVVKALNDQFTDEFKQPKPIDIGGGIVFEFKDITFFSVEKEQFENARLDVNPPRKSGNDPTGDLGLGRQQLLLKWLLEGEYITVPGYHLQGRPLEDIMTELRDATGIRPLEGFEWGILQAFNLVKSNAYLRVRGASQRDSVFNSLFVSQLHDAGKAGIRAALARMVADERASQIVLDVTRGSYATSACLAILPAQTPQEWADVPCKSFEEYVASAAGRTVKRGLDLFTELQVESMIYLFFQIKADEVQITDEDVADRFIAMASQFVDGVVDATIDIYNQTIGSDPDSAQRQVNRTTALTKRVNGMASGTLHVVPRVFHRGAIEPPDVDLTMYRGSPVGGLATPIRSTRVSLNANESRLMKTNEQGVMLPEPLDGLSEEDRNLNDLGSGTDSSQREPMFRLGDPDDPSNPLINFNAEAGLVRYVAFTIDLPEKRVAKATGTTTTVVSSTTSSTASTACPIVGCHSAADRPMPRNMLLEPRRRVHCQPARAGHAGGDAQRRPGHRRREISSWHGAATR